jgi:2-polyprenyl-3-methyl-5-hydroxy-6-metoxy-1,4-benzoquinol methylase
MDFGCGEGGLSGELLGAGWKAVVGIDVSRSRVARAQLRFPAIRFDDRGLAALDDYHEAFDLIVMDNVIEHLPRPVEVLRRLRSCLVAGGTLVAITPNMESGRFKMLGRLWTQELSPHAHIFLFTESSLSAAMEAAAMRVTGRGNFHLTSAVGHALREFGRDRRAKDLLWRLGHEVAGTWGRMIGAGEMIYAVAKVPSKA